MAKTRRAKSKPVRAKKSAPPPARTLLEFTHQGFDALLARIEAGASGEDGKSADKRKAFAEAVERLKSEYARVLKG